MTSSALHPLVDAHFRLERAKRLWFVELEGQSAKDLRWSPDGQTIAVVARRIELLSRVEHEAIADAFVVGPVGAVGLRREPGAPAVAGRSPTTVDFGHDGLLVSGWSDGSVRRGTSSEALVTLSTPVLRLRCSPGADAVAIATDEGSYLWSGTLKELGGKAKRGTVLEAEGDRIVGGGDRALPQGLAWTTSGSALAVADDRGVTVYDGEGGVVRSHAKPADDVAWWGDTLLRVDGNMLAIDGPDGTRALGPLHPYPAEMSRCTALSVSGAFALASFFSMNEGHFVLIDLEAGLFAPALDPPNIGTTTPLAFSPKGNTLAYVDDLHRVFIYPWNPEARGPTDDERRFAALLDSGLTDAEWALAELAKIDVLRLPPDRQIVYGRKKDELTSRARKQAAIAQSVIPEGPLAAPRRGGASDDEDEWTVGTAVSHPKFGAGVVEDVTETGGATKLSIRFGGETKALLAKFVRRVG